MKEKDQFMWKIEDFEAWPQKFNQRQSRMIIFRVLVAYFWILVWLILLIHIA